ncbi:MAG: hypothetical protein WC974_03615 [Thermoplasmata archaeon]
MQAYEGDVTISPGVTHRMLGIQYWFYYPYHDCPTGVAHQHDWWYFWIVYDEVAHNPYEVIYDFHHNVRVIKWTDPYLRVQKEYPQEFFHTRVYVDAGGHRSLYAKGADVLGWVTALEYWNDRDVASGILQADPTPDDDEIFGVMIV